MKLNPSLFYTTIFLLFALLTGCGYLHGMNQGLSDLVRVRDPGSVRQTIAIPLFENGTIEPLLEKRISRVFKETFISRGWKVISDPEGADLVLKGRIKRYHRAPLSLDLQGQAREYRVQIGLHFHLEQKKGGEFETSAEGRAEYLARSDAKASRSAEDRAIREAGRKLAGKMADLLLTRITPTGRQKADP
ncbi:MAG: LPS assembly lipoprotein LptE [Nitrospiria bacterium]